MMASRVCECISYTICNTNVLSKVYVSATTFVQYKFKKKIYRTHNPSKV